MLGILQNDSLLAVLGWRHAVANGDNIKWTGMNWTLSFHSWTWSMRERFSHVNIALYLMRFLFWFHLYVILILSSHPPPFFWLVELTLQPPVVNNYFWSNADLSLSLYPPQFSDFSFKMFLSLPYIIRTCKHTLYMLRALSALLLWQTIPLWVIALVVKAIVHAKILL